jgi:hypothetical protein
MANGCDALFCPLPAAGSERIGSDIDVCASVVFVGEPTEISRRKYLFQPNDSLGRTFGVVPAEQESNAVAYSEATGEEVGGGLVHRYTSERNAMEVRYWLGLHRGEDNP